MNSKRLLVVDDDDGFRKVLARALTRRGHVVAQASDGAGAMEQAETQSFDGVILDLRLGEESGLHLLEGLRERQPKARILLFTGYASIVTAVEAIKRGANNYLPKPAPVEEILTALFEESFGAVVPATPVHPRRLEWEHLQRVLADHEGNISSAARALGLHRRSLQRKLGKKPFDER